MFGEEKWAVDWAGPELMPGTIATLEQNRRAEAKIREEARKVAEARAEAERKAEEDRKAEEARAEAEEARIEQEAREEADRRIFEARASSGFRLALGKGGEGRLGRPEPKQRTATLSYLLVSPGSIYSA